MTGPKPSRNTAPIRIGGKTYSSLEELPPEVRQKFERMVVQMRESGMLEDKNRDGIPDRFETSLRVVGWFGKLTGNPQLMERLQQQLKAYGAALGTTATPTRSQPPPTPSTPARIRTTSTGGRTSLPSATSTRQRAGTSPGNPHQSAVQRNDHASHEDSGLREFLRKLVIVSTVVIAGYVGVRLLGGG